MAKRKKNKTSEATVSKKTSAKNLLASSFALTLGTTWLSLLVVAGFLALWQVPQDNTRQINASSTRLAQHQAQSLQVAISQGRAQLQAYALYPAIIELLAAQDMISLEQHAQQLSYLFPSIASLRLIPLGPLGIAGLGKNNISLRNNIEVDMVRRASQKDAVPVELYIDEEQWLLSIAQPVVDQNDVAVGAILLTLNKRFIDDILARLDPALGQTSLQLSGSKKRIVSEHGNQGVDTYRQQASIPYQGWQLSFTPSQELITERSNKPLNSLIALGSAALLITLLALLAYRQLSQTITRHFDLLVGYAEKLNDKTKASSPQFSLARFAEIATKMSELRRMGVNETNGKQAVVEKPGQTADPLFQDESLDDVLDLDNLDSLDDVLDLDDSLLLSESEMPELNEQIFRAYDIRGIAESELNEAVCYHLGLAIGSEAGEQGQQSVVVACDGRHSSPTIKDAISQGLMDSGRDVIDIGMQPTPLLYFACHHLDTQSGVMITGSHNPSEYNGLKIVIDGTTLSYDAIQKLKQRIQTQNYQKGQGSHQQQDVSEDYIDTITCDVAIAQPLKVVVDCGNGVAGTLTPRLIEELGCEVIPLYCDIDGDFPNHHPDPSIVENLQDLIAAVDEHQADLGIALDGDGDRIGVVSGSGKVILPDRLLMLFAQDVVSRNPGTDVIFDVKSTRHLNTLISSYGGRPIMWKSGHSYIKEKMQETGALLGGELSGHIFFKERWFGFDDGIYSAARLIEILSTSDADLDNQLSAFTESISTAELHINVSEDNKFALMATLGARAKFGDAKVSTLDGIRADFPDGWGLVRASNTTPVLTLRFEADTEEALQRIQNQFKEQLSAIDSSLSFPF